MRRIEPGHPRIRDAQFVGAISKEGSGTPRRLLVQALHCAVHPVGDPSLSRFYEKIERQKNTEPAALTTARTLSESGMWNIERCPSPKSPDDISKLQHEWLSVDSAWFFIIGFIPI